MTEVHVDVAGRSIKLTNLDKVMYPSTGTTKGEVLDYYARIAPFMLPHLQDRAVTRIRWPHGVEDQSFFEKNAPAGTPSWVRCVDVPTSGSRGGSGEHLRFPVLTDLASLMWMVNLSALELHVHQWTVDEDGQPAGANRLVIDLDPGEPAGLQECCEVALEVRRRLQDIGLDPLPVTSGGKGLHLYAKLTEPVSPAETSKLAKQVAEAMTRDLPRKVTATMTKSQRGGKVFLDWSQNAGAKTTISPYSLRGRARPTAAGPLEWSEVEAGASDPGAIHQLTLNEVLTRAEAKGDLLASLLADRQG